MANKKMFQTKTVAAVPLNSTVLNNAGGVAYKVSSKQALCNIACTGTFNNTFYVSAKDQLATVKTLLSEVEPEFVARLAVYAREKGMMKDLPSALLASLASTDGKLFARVFPRVVDNTKMLRNVVQMIRSGEFGRKSLGSLPKRVVQNWLAGKDDRYLFKGSIGTSPSLGDVIKMIHPRPETESRKALYGYLTGAMTDSKYEAFSTKPGNAEKKVSHYDPSKLPELVRSFETFKQAPEGMILPPDLSFEMLTALPLNKAQWVEIARNATWTQTRMNLNTFLRHGVFDEPGMDALIAERLSNPELITKSRVFPYQLMVAYQNADQTIPMPVRMALQTAMELATKNVPVIDGNVFVFPDVSGSMRSPVTGSRDGGTSKVQCIDVAALFASCILRTNKSAQVMPFEVDVVDTEQLGISAENTVISNATKLASIRGGGTNCAAPLMKLNRDKTKGDVLIFISDNESNLGSSYRQTAMMEQWKLFKENNPAARMICIDITPNTTSQIKSHQDILQCAGFNDQVFSVIESFLAGGSDRDYWVKKIEALEI